MASNMFNADYLSANVSMNETIESILLESIDFPNLLRYMDVSDDIKKTILRWIANTDGNYDRFKRALSSSGQEKVLRFIESSSIGESEITELKSKIIIPMHIRDRLYDMIYLDGGLIAEMSDARVIDDRQAMRLKKDKVLYQRVQILIDEYVPNMTRIQYDDFKRILSQSQSHVAIMLP